MTKVFVCTENKITKDKNGEKRLSLRDDWSHISSEWCS